MREAMTDFYALFPPTFLSFFKVFSQPLLSDFIFSGDKPKISWSLASLWQFFFFPGKQWVGDSKSQTVWE